MKVPLLAPHSPPVSTIPMIFVSSTAIQERFQLSSSTGSGGVPKVLRKSRPPLFGPLLEQNRAPGAAVVV